MTWREEFKEASFRGVPFKVTLDEDERGQRLVVHEFPGRNLPKLEPMGRKADRFVVEGFLVGDDHLALANKLRTACLTEGPGELVHPWFGKMQAECESIRTRREQGELGITRASMVFYEAGDQEPVVRAINTQARATLSALEMVNQQKSAFEKAFEYAQLPYSAAQATIGAVQAAVDAVALSRSRVAQTAAFAQRVQALKAQVSALILNTTRLAEEFITLITFGLLTPEPGQEETPDARAVYTGLAPLFTYTPTAQTAPAIAFGQLVRGTSIAQGGDLLSKVEFESVEESAQMKERLYLAMDALQEESEVSDQLFAAVHALRAAVERDVSERAVQLPRLVEMTLPEFSSAVLLSYSVYGSVDQEEAIIRRNKIEHPGLLPSDIPLKLVTDAG